LRDAVGQGFEGASEADFTLGGRLLASPPENRQQDQVAVGGQLHAAISNAIVRLHREYLGRGPTRARTSIRDNVVVVIMEDTLTKAEQSLVADGKEDEVLRVRHSFQRTMRNDMVAAVERLTARRVIAFMSSNHIDPDLASETFVLEPDPTMSDELERAAETLVVIAPRAGRSPTMTDKIEA
jgi:uncharacterized protein YbcI